MRSAQKGLYQVHITMGMCMNNSHGKSITRIALFEIAMHGNMEL